MPVVAIVGHVDNGKSSFLSSVLYPEHKGDPYRLDTLDEEKERGITHEFSTHEIEGITFVDTAGHHSFIRSNIEAYTSIHIDLALIMCSQRRGEFNSGFVMKNQTQAPLREQLLLLRSNEVKRAIIVVTKTDLSPQVLEDINVIIPPLEQYLKFIQMSVIGHAHRISAKTGFGVPELLDAIRSVPASMMRREVVAPTMATAFTCKLMVLFIPPNRFISVGSEFIAHSQGVEAECVLEQVKTGGAPLLKVFTEYVALIRLKRPIPIGKRVIIRTCESTVGYCKVKRTN